MGDSAYNIDESSSKHPVSVEAENLSYVIDIQDTKKKRKCPCFKKPADEEAKPETKQVLDEVSFKVNSGQMLAIMGASGSGKTSLLNVLSCRQMGGEVTGNIRLNGVEHTKRMIENFSAYVQQSDRLLQYLTVHETMMFIANLKLPTKLTKSEKEAKVDEVINELGLSHVSKSQVGGTNIRGVSGGERRRVSIGMQLLMNPSILFLDEPTSGLDAFTANHLIQTLGNLAKNQRTVILSIHQPRSDIFELFDMILVLSLGKTVYFGEAARMVEYFTDLGFPCPELTNPSDFYLDLATVDFTSDETEAKTSEVLTNLVGAYKDHSASQEKKEDGVDQQLVEVTIAGASANGKGYPGYFRQAYVLTKRHFKNAIVDYWFLMASVIQSLIMSLIVGSIFWNLGKDQVGISDRFGFFFIIGQLYSYTISQDVISQNHRERQYLYFELQDKLYGHFAYFTAKLVAELPFHFVFVLLYFAPAFFMVDVGNGVDLFFVLYGVLLLVVYCSKSISALFANSFPNFTSSSMFVNLVTAAYTLCGGYFLHLDSITDGFDWISDISYIRWSFQSMSRKSMTGMSFTCKREAKFCVLSGKEALESYSLDDEDIYVGYLVMSVSIVVYQSLAFIAMRFLPQKPYQY